MPMVPLRTLSILIPVYNEEKTVAEILQKLQALQLPKNIKKQIIVIDDASSDNTANIIKKNIKDSMILLQHTKNQGKGAAIRTGLVKATGEYIIIQDADLEYDPSYIPTLLEPIITAKTSVVYGTRLDRLPHLQKEERRSQFLLHYIGNRFLSLFTSILYGQWLTDMETGYKIFPREGAKKFNLQARGFELEPEITAKLLKQGYKILEVPITTNPRTLQEGKKLNTVRDGIKAVIALIKYRFSD